ncbi:hypothetical protein OZD70_03055 [Wolbachia endosymbiont of Drosophila tsacasi]|nr:hypothetical protein [Wolbachia endosymbiont of Drosophila tsacasi]MDE5062223.1 hypothetical protein [Wolbachia endosymbiont of Drosophila tsacasi]
MVAILNITKGKNKVIVSGLAGALSALIFLTAIHIAAKIAIIVSAATVTYLLLLLIHKIRTKKEQPAEITGVSGDKVSEDEGYSSVDEGEEKDTAKEPERTEAELEEEMKMDYLNIWISKVIHFLKALILKIVISFLVLQILLWNLYLNTWMRLVIHFLSSHRATLPI